MIPTMRAQTVSVCVPTIYQHKAPHLVPQVAVLAHRRQQQGPTRPKLVFSNVSFMLKIEKGGPWAAIWGAISYP